MKILWKKNENKLADYTKNFIISSIENAEAGELTSIPGSYLIFAYDEPKLKLMIAKRLNVVVNKLDTNQLAKLDTIFRDKTSMEWFIDWRMVQIDLSISGMTEDEKITVLGLGSFNPNGYFRERCLKQLSNYSDIKAISFICLRLRDWVPAIMVSARSYLSEIIKRGIGLNILEMIPFLLKIRQSQLEGPREVLNLLQNALSKKAEILKEGVLSKNIFVKRYCYSILLQVCEDVEYFYGRVERDKDTISRQMILKKILEFISVEDLIKRAPLLLRNRSSEIRRLTMDKMFELKVGNVKEILKNMLLDKSASIREEARYLLSKIDNIDYRVFYISNLQSVASIYGLGETGKKEDAEKLILFVASENSQLVIAAMSAIANLTDDEYIGLFTENLSNKNMSISKRAFRLLQKKNYSAYADSINRIFLGEKPSYIRKSCAFLLISLPKWDAIKYILEICADKESDIRILGEVAYSSWVNKYNRSFTNPTAEQIIGLQKVFEFVSPNKKKYLEFLISELN